MDANSEEKELRKIQSLQDLAMCAEVHKSVVCPSMWGLKTPKPAAIVMHFQGTLILKILLDGLYEYEPKVKKAFHKIIRE